MLCVGSTHRLNHFDLNRCYWARASSFVKNSVFSNKPVDIDPLAKRMFGPPLGSAKSAPITQLFWAGFMGGLGVLGLGWAMTGGMSPLAVGIGAVFFLSAMAVALWGLQQSYPHPSIGLCNRVTVARLMMASVLITAWLAQIGGWPVFALAALAFGLDGLDGWLARREGCVSDFGARFDMEVDSVLALVLALLAVSAGTVSGLILLLGLPRYVFWIAQFPCPWLAGDLPERFSRKVVCVLQILALLIAVLPLAEAALANAMIIGAAVALVWSFGIDVRWLWRARS